MRLFVILAVTVLAACTEPVPGVANDQAAVQPAAPAEAAKLEDVGNVMSEPVESDEPAAPADKEQGRQPPDDEADQCGASEYQWLVGQPRSRIPEKPAGATWRVTCTGCPITMDYSPSRLNIFYDEDTEIVEEVRCG